MNQFSKLTNSENALRFPGYGVTKLTSEALLRHTQASLKAIIENTSATIYSLDREFRCVIFNNNLRETVRSVYNVEIKVGDVIFDFLYKNDVNEANEWREIYTRALGGESMQFVKEFNVGKYHSFLRFYLSPIAEGDVITGLSCMAIDITNEKLAELSAVRGEALFRALIENTRDAIIIRDNSMNLIYASPSTARLLGYDINELKLKSAPDTLIHKDDLQIIKNVFQESAALPGIAVPIALRVKHKTGRYLWCEGVVTNMLNVEHVHGFVCNFRDVTERRELDIQNELIATDLVRRNENLEQYSYIVSHNLRAPIANLVGLANLLEIPSISQQDREVALHHIFSSARHLDDVIRDLSSILQTKEELNQHRETVSFRELIDKISLSIDSMVLQNNVVIDADFSEGSGIVSVKSYIHSIFYNLISNSIKFRNPNVRPVIRIRSYRQKDKMIIVFKDNGLGIDLKNCGDKIFGLYKRFHHSIAEGKGVGLFMVKTQVENLGGKVSVESEPGKGSVFTIEL